MLSRVRYWKHILFPTERRVFDLPKAPIPPRVFVIREGCLRLSITLCTEWLDIRNQEVYRLFFPLVSSGDWCERNEAIPIGNSGIYTSVNMIDFYKDVIERGTRVHTVWMHKIFYGFIDICRYYSSLKRIERCDARKLQDTCNVQVSRIRKI